MTTIDKILKIWPEDVRLYSNGIVEEFYELGQEVRRKCEKFPLLYRICIGEKEGDWCVNCSKNKTILLLGLVVFYRGSGGSLDLIELYVDDLADFGLKNVYIGKVFRGIKIKNELKDFFKKYEIGDIVDLSKMSPTRKTGCWSYDISVARDFAKPIKDDNSYQGVVFEYELCHNDPSVVIDMTHKSFPFIDSRSRNPEKSLLMRQVKAKIIEFI